MKEVFSLSNDLPTMPTPHDCVIERIYKDKDCLVFDFEQNITIHDSVRYYCPTAKSLTIRYHLLDTAINLYQEKTKRKLQGFVSTYTSMKDNALFQIAGQKHKLKYLYHYVSFNSIILILWSGREIRLELPSVDCIEFNWIE